MMDGVEVANVLPYDVGESQPVEKIEFTHGETAIVSYPVVIQNYNSISCNISLILFHLLNTFVSHIEINDFLENYD